MPTPAPPDLPTLAEPPRCCTTQFECQTGWNVSCVNNSWDPPLQVSSSCVAECTAVPWYEVYAEAVWYATSCEDGGCIEVGQCPTPPETPPAGYPEGECDGGVSGDCEAGWSAECTGGAWDVNLMGTTCKEPGTCVQGVWEFVTSTSYTQVSCASDDGCKWPSDLECFGAPDPIPYEPPYACLAYCVANWSVTCTGGSTWDAPSLGDTTCSDTCTTTAWYEVISNYAWAAVDCIAGDCPDIGGSCPTLPDTPPTGYPTGGGCSPSPWPSSVTISYPELVIPAGCTLTTEEKFGPGSQTIAENCGGGCYQLITTTPGGITYNMLLFWNGPANNWQLQVVFFAPGGGVSYQWQGGSAQFVPTGGYAFNSSSAGCGTVGNPGGASVS